MLVAELLEVPGSQEGGGEKDYEGSQFKPPPLSSDLGSLQFHMMNGSEK